MYKHVALFIQNTSRASVCRAFSQALMSSSTPNGRLCGAPYFGGKPCDAGSCCSLAGRCTREASVCGEPRAHQALYTGVPGTSCPPDKWGTDCAQDRSTPARTPCGPKHHAHCPWSPTADLCCAVDATGGAGSRDGVCKPCQDVGAGGAWLWDVRQKKWYMH